MKRFVVAAVVLFICIACSRLGYLINNEGFIRVEPLDKRDVCRLLEDETTPREDLSMLLVNDDRLFLYFDYEGIINVYSHDGVFLYGFQIESQKKGTGDIAFHDKLLYVKARGGRMYIFEDDLMISYFRSTDDAVSYKKAEEYMDGVPCNKASTTSFHIVGNKIMKSVDNGPYQTVITLPARNPEIRELAIAILLTIAGLAHYLRKIPR